MPLLFLDCEFTSLEDPRLLSLALVGVSGASLYEELSQDALMRLDLAPRCNQFVKQVVLPQWGRMKSSHGAGCQDLDELARRIARGISELHPTGFVEVAYDYHTDFDLLESALRGAKENALLARLVPTHVGYLRGDEHARDAMHQAWQNCLKSDGVGEHHAWADAQALKAAFEVVHGPL